MRRFKILVGITLFILTLFVLILSFGNPVEAASKPKNEISFVKSKQRMVDPKVAYLYNVRQQKLKAAVEKYFERSIGDGTILGAGVSIVRGDSIVLADGFGRRNAKNNDRVDGGTVFRLGSLSKGFAGALAASVKYDGKLTWTDKVSDYLPDFQLGDSGNTSNITLANILSHTSGTPYHSYTNLVEAGLPLTSIAKQFKNVVPISKPGLMYSYQNAMFALCGEMMQVATGQKINELLVERFFRPLEMCTTITDHKSLTQVENIALPHTRNGKGWRTLSLTDKYYNAIAAGGISSNARDMGRWMRFLLGHNPDVLKQTALAEAFNPFIEIKGSYKYYQRWPGHLRSYYGFGWRIHQFVEDGSDEEKTMWHHGGSVNNYRNEIALYPEADMGICVLLNSNSRLASTVIPDLYQIVKDVYGEDISAKIAVNDKTAGIDPPL